MDMSFFYAQLYNEIGIKYPTGAKLLSSNYGAQKPDYYMVPAIRLPMTIPYMANRPFWILSLEKHMKTPWPMVQEAAVSSK